ncbi:hypothetical protein LEN26_000992 [Aphanomyces euteiches]|nr:hypothetical protein AeMF1_013542 [Aphanomyces euteiches]KAH9162320.1 hypothetical protein LEN26_000992 [Aphanomyces euteiches]KAH9190115.1 hypothetical protein AeNC1_007906 [Aphanomyces euteiches]
MVDSLAEPEAETSVMASSSVIPPLVIAGPSGVGKGTLINKLLAKYPTLFGFSVSHTTRGPRPGEENGIAYHFVTKDEFDEAVEANAFLEYARVHGNGYGTSKQAVESVQSQNKICVLDIDIQGVQQVKKADLKDVHFLFVAPPSMTDLESRLRGRGTETEEKIALRLANAEGELAYANEGHFDKILVNREVDQAFAELEATLIKWYPTVDFTQTKEDS